MFRHKLYIPNLILIVICIVVLLAIYMLNTLGNNRSNSHSLGDIKTKDSCIQYLQNSKDDLYLAENAYQFYLGTHDTVHKNKFLSHIQSFIHHLDRSNVLNNNNSDTLAVKLQRKMYLANAVIRLKEFADQILISSIKDSGYSQSLDLSKGKVSNILQKYLSHNTDTIKYVPVKQKKNLLKKISSIFKEEEDSIASVTHSSSSSSSSIDTLNFSNNSQLNKFKLADQNIKKYYTGVLKKELQVRSRIDEKNKLAALNNHIIFTNVQSEINSIVKNIEKERQENTYKTIESLQANYFDQNMVFILSLSVISILILMLGYKVVVARQYERDIILDKQQAVALSEMKASFLNTMSHEIRTPLTAIIGFADHIYNKGIDDKTQEYTQYIKYASDHLLETVNDVLEFSKLESGNVKTINEPFKIQSLLEGVINTYKLQADKKNIALILKSTVSNSLVVNGDSFHLRQILYNLINNAIKFTDKGQISLSASANTLNEKTTELTFIVQDTGKGIAPDALQKVFKEFIQIKDNNDKSDAQTAGTGLGLSITQKLVKLFGGSIKLESELDKGSKFTVTIPFSIANESELKKTVVVQTLPQDYQFEGKRILLAEDSEPILYLAKTILDEMKIDVNIAKNGEEAWELFNLDKNGYDFILTDIEMPKLNGNELARRIRNTSSKIPIIAMTAHTSTEAYEQYKQDGVSAVITKPFKRTELNTVLAQHL